MEDCQALSELLSSCTSLKKLNIRNNHIDSDGACQLVCGLCANNTLQFLNLSDNPIGDKGATVFAEMLLKNRSLKGLDLQGSKIGEEGAKKLNESLTHNTTVQLWLPELVMESQINRGVGFKRCTSQIQ